MIDANEVHVWYLDLATERRDSGALSQLLSPTERERARRFHFERDRLRFLAAHAALRNVLASYVGVEAEELLFGEGDFGKPFIAQPVTNIRFSATHSEDVAAFAVTVDAEVGIDLEVVGRQLGDELSLAGSCFSEPEQRALAVVPTERRKAVFLRGWTRKEAYLKAIGLGLQVPPEEVPVSFDDVRHALNEWTVIPLNPGPHAIAALVAPAGREWVIREWWREGGR